MGWRIGPSKAEVDYLVIGSGFGGSVMAATLAERCKNVCLFERGKAYPPGSFPRGLPDLASNFWHPTGRWHGMYDVWSFQGIDAVVASGLGGGSLIYANVMLRKPSSWFEQTIPGSTDNKEEWSFGYSDLREHYVEVEKFLRVQTLPVAFENDRSPKTGLFKSTSPDTESAPLAVRFRLCDDDAATEPPLPGTELPEEKEYPNVHGMVRRTTCTMCGECDVGCNDGAKSSMDHTYISKAAHDGAEICIRTEVREIRRCPDRSGYQFDVSYVVHSDVGEPRFGSIKAKRVILAAGTLGSTYLMLSNAGRLQIPADNLKLIGSRFCGNGDLLGFAIPRDGDQDQVATKGPVITTYRRHLPGRADPTEPRMFLQDGGVPEISNLKLRWRDVPRLTKKWCEFLEARRANSGYPSIAAEPQTTLMSRFLAALPLLGMGADTADGRLSIDTNERLQCDWTVDNSEAHFAALQEQLVLLSEQLGSDYRVNPQFPLQNRVITVHPLGGCPADTTKCEGVVDSYGRVRGVPGLWITDGSVMPGPVGANPSLTIAAFARRAAMELREECLKRPSIAAPFTASD